MKRFVTLALSALALSACAPSGTVSTAPAPAPVPAQTPRQPPPPAPSPAVTPPVVAATVAPAVREAARDWQLLDEATDHFPGISVNRAYRELLAGKQAQPVLVAIIDGGVDTAHVDLKANLWVNPKEIAGNNRDDDGNGHVDDIRGWNFIGSPNGQDVHYDTYELTRLYARCTASAPGPSALALPKMDRQQCDAINEEFQKKQADVEQSVTQIRAIDAVMSRSLPLLKKALGTDSLSVGSVTLLHAATPEIQQARSLYLRLAASGVTPEAVAQAKKDYESQLAYALNPTFDPRSIVGDDYANVSQHDYGNTDVMGPDAQHGTHVAGIIGAVRGNGIGIDGIASAARIMMVRAVPDGDERDKDIANAIRYAVDNGARVINMSFGKSYSPFKPVVDEAVRYADAHGVLMIHAAGNDGQDLATSPNFPTRMYTGGGSAVNWIEVGASSWRGGDTLAVSFSNYSHDMVDVFAPGEDILSTVPGGYERLSGTSMASPVVTGLAALIMSYYPQLSASEVKRVILESATRYGDRMVVRPGAPSEDLVPFSSLSVTGGIVNAYSAMKLAAKISSAKR